MMNYRGIKDSLRQPHSDDRRPKISGVRKLLVVYWGRSYGYWVLGYWYCMGTGVGPIIFAYMKGL